MATLNYYLSAKEEKQTGKKEVCVRFYHGRKIDARAKTNIFVTPSTWNEKTQRVIVPRARVIDAEMKADIAARIETNKELDLLAEHIQNSFLAAGAGKYAAAIGDKWLPELIKNYTRPDLAAKEAAAANDFFPCLQSWIDAKEESRYKDHYRVFLRSLKRFEAFSGEKITFDNLTSGTIDAYREFLAQEHLLQNDAKYKAAFKLTPESREVVQRSQETIRNYLNKLRAFTRKMRDCTPPKMQSNPFAGYEMPEANYDERTPYYPSLEERNKLWRFDFSGKPALERQRDVFIFQCVIGCRVSDLRRLKKSDVQNGIVEFIPFKTREKNPVTARVPLNSIAREIVAKYQDLPGDKLLPCISDQKYNDAIKAMFEAAGLNRLVKVIDPKTRAVESKPLYEVASSHIARRCFVGNLYKQVQDPKLISELTKHREDSRSFERYRRVEDTTLQSLVEMLED